MLEMSEGVSLPKCGGHIQALSRPRIGRDNHTSNMHTSSVVTKLKNVQKELALK